jgi:pSer/pThr/pTyr-binding forkhead associated (FHA) protein
MTIAREISITFMSGPQDGRTLRFPQPEPGAEVKLHVGRRDDCEIHLAFDNQVSRLHAQIGCVAQPVSASESVISPYVLSFFIEDLNSRNGTFVEREKKTIRGRVNLRPGSLFRIGRTWMRLDEPMPL